MFSLLQCNILTLNISRENCSAKRFNTLVASGVYLLNKIVDRTSDYLNPEAFINKYVTLVQSSNPTVTHLLTGTMRTRI